MYIGTMTYRYMLNWRFCAPRGDDVDDIRVHSNWSKQNATFFAPRGDVGLDTSARFKEPRGEYSPRSPGNKDSVGGKPLAGGDVLMYKSEVYVKITDYTLVMGLTGTAAGYCSRRGSVNLQNTRGINTPVDEMTYLSPDPRLHKSYYPETRFFAPRLVGSTNMYDNTYAIVLQSDELYNPETRCSAPRRVGSTGMYDSTRAIVTPT
ncbi:hypothetical protein BDN72DRAFT_941725 [Pluteus cervinus]|uniref:Uncharacterized protein n=1 Tax=Pluteus cervinus TaxID=181527 RepID=A0ACD3A3R8_9AGAR|nr:hypothetical protein BDN72DRAFT_941725 [Pluteus cervinus]